MATRRARKTELDVEVQRLRSARRAERAPVTITLTLQHRVNLDTYGPGQVTVPRELAQVLLEQESRMAVREKMLYEPRAGLIGQGGQRIPVAPSFFDVALAQADHTIGTIGGGG